MNYSNDNFKKRLLPLEGHRAMMEAVGFKAKANLWEWTWHEERSVAVVFGAHDCIDYSMLVPGYVTKGLNYGCVLVRNTTRRGWLVVPLSAH